MNKTQISYVMPQADFVAIKEAIKTINEKMPFLISLTPEEIGFLTKLGPKSIDFAQDAYTASLNFPNILPPVFDKVEYGKDTELFNNMGEIKMLIDSLKEKVESTYRAVGSESMTASLTVYGLVQSASKTTPGLKSVAEQLGKRFKKHKKNTSNDTPSDNP
ncbi:MAG: hypothetical protein HOP30_20615, partial [Cyclobacteriaceae bacterium]|nr:hypothetical protein [Cyclobacteriaceae bacterium]